MSGIDSKLRELGTIEKTTILQKPFDAWQLANKLREVIDRKETWLKPCLLKDFLFFGSSHSRTLAHSRNSGSVLADDNS